VKAQSSNKVERREGGCQPSLPIIIKFKGQGELKEMKEGALITVASSYENVHKERGTTKLRERRKLKEMKKGASIAIINSFENN
jgi:hypothetical protein